ncbi:MAG: Ku protein [Acidimicrobiia bacterium]
MPRAIWSGSISFGLVNVPVGLHAATESKDVRFHEFEEGSGRRIRHERVAEGTDDEVDYDHVVKGYEVSDDRYVMLTQEELESVEPGKSRAIEIESFVRLDEIDPVYFEKSYYLAPKQSGEKAYALLRDAMERSARVAIGRFVMRSKQHLAAIRPSGPVLILETMFFGDEVRPTDELGLPRRAKPVQRELRIAEQLIDSLTVHFDPSAYTDTYRDRILDLIEAKAKGEEIVVERRDEPAEPVGDLMAALKASLTDISEARSRRRPKQDLAGLSKEELYERAAEKSIPGRSKMSKQKLIAALDPAS